MPSHSGKPPKPAPLDLKAPSVPRDLKARPALPVLPALPARRVLRVHKVAPVHRARPANLDLPDMNPRKRYGRRDPGGRTASETRQPTRSPGVHGSRRTWNDFLGCRARTGAGAHRNRAVDNGDLPDNLFQSRHPGDRERDFSRLPNCSE